MLKATEDPTRVAQQLTSFNGHYGSWCYLPLLAFLTFDDEAAQYLCAAILRPGNALAMRDALTDSRSIRWLKLPLLLAESCTCQLVFDASDHVTFLGLCPSLHL